ncbi:interferon gamma receptor 1 [Clupea harengus]|uniref:Interferon gamma receptor 1 n=1 Tax=Clupea harengus TaxID=7950 RepID=A0A6P8EZX7_CLUHA|nr:interferon gamma receptor 1 [Clupea harengus]
MDFTVWGFICAVGVLTSLDSGQAVVLPCPENVTVSCDNFETFVYWNYSEHLVDPFFQINLTMDTEENQTWSFKSVGRYANITSQLNSNYAIYTLSIRARNVTHESDFSPPVTFTYDKSNEGIEGSMLCKLDFPPINLEYQYGFLTLKFRNPMHLYENTLALKYLKDNTYPNLETSELSYNVIDQSNIPTVFSCPYQKAICEEKLQISDKEDQYCVNLSGSIVRAEFRPARICYSGLKPKGLPPPTTMAIVFTSLLVVMAVVLGTLVFRKMINKTHPTTPTNLTSFRHQIRPILLGPSENFSPSPLSVVPLLSPSETSEDPLLPNSGRSSADCSRFQLLTQEQQGRAGQENKEEDEERNTESTEWPSDGSSTDYPPNSELLERSGGTLVSDYDSPHSVEMSSGDKEEERNTESCEWPSDGLSTDPDYPPNSELLEGSGGTLGSDYDSRQEMSSGDWVEGYSARDPVA